MRLYIGGNCFILEEYYYKLIFSVKITGVARIGEGSGVYYFICLFCVYMEGSATSSKDCHEKEAKARKLHSPLQNQQISFQTEQTMCNFFNNVII